MRLIMLVILLLMGCDSAYDTCKACKHACDPGQVKYCDAHKCECLHPPK